MNCKLHDSGNVNMIYHRLICNGGSGVYTKENVPIYQCADLKMTDYIVVNLEK